MKRNKIFCILASLTMLVAAGASASYNNSYVNQNPVVAEAAATIGGTYEWLPTMSNSINLLGSKEYPDLTLKGTLGEIFDHSTLKNNTLQEYSCPTNTTGKTFDYELKTGGQRSFEIVLGDSNQTGSIEIYAWSSKTSSTRYITIDGVQHSVGKTDANDVKVFTQDFTGSSTIAISSDSVMLLAMYITVDSMGDAIDPLNVYYNHNYEGSSNYNTLTDEYGYISNTYTPTRDGYDFDGWFTDEGCTTEFDFTQPVSIDTTLYAKWIKIVNIEAEGNIVGNLDNLKGLTLKLEDAEQGLSYTYTVSDSLTYDFGTIKNGNYTLSTNDTTGLISITSSTEIVIENETDVVGDIVIESLDKMNKSYSWDVTQGLVKGYNGNGLIALEDMPYNAEKGYAQGTTNPSISSNTPSSGAAIKFIAGANGTVTVNLTFGSSAKTNYASCDGTVLVSYKGQSEDYDLVFEVEAGKTYYVYGSGTKFMFEGISFVKATSAVLNYQYDNDAAPTAVRFIGTITDLADYKTIESITLSFKLDGNDANKTVNITKLYTSVANTFEEVDNTYYVCYAITEITAAIGQSFEATLTVTFNNGNEALTQTRSFTLGE